METIWLNCELYNGTATDVGRAGRACKAEWLRLWGARFPARPPVTTAGSRNGTPGLQRQANKGSSFALASAGAEGSGSLGAAAVEQSSKRPREEGERDSPAARSQPETAAAVSPSKSATAGGGPKSVSSSHAAARGPIRT